MKCLDCGEQCSGIRCRDCRAVHAKTSRWVYDNSEVVLTNGHWFNDNGIMRWYHD